MLKEDSPNIFELNGISFDKRIQFYNDNIKSFRQVLDSGISLNKEHLIQIESEINNSVYLDNDFFSVFLNKLTFPLQCLDTEVITSILPLDNEFDLFSKTPFLFSIHTLAQPLAAPTHYDFFITLNTNTLRKFAEKLIKALNTTSSIIVYDAILEKKIFDDIAKAFPDLAKDCLQLKHNIIDFAPVFKSFKVYFPGMLGRFSLKAIHSSINKAHNHSNLLFQSGSDALTNMKVYLNSSKSNQKLLEKELRAYCKMDTQALIDIINYIYTVYDDKSS